MISNSELVRVLVGLLSLLVVAHGCGAVFIRIGQPKVIGEIVGGLLLGPTILGWAAPGLEAWLFTASQPARAVMGTVQQLGLFLLMFCSGAEVRGRFRASERRLVVATSVIGLIIPFAAGITIAKLLNMQRYWGPAGNEISFVLIFSTAIAVTSIPVISRIMHDLGILGTSFSRVVLGVAVVEDLVLYAVLAVALALSNRQPSGFGLPAVMGLQPGSTTDIAYHVVLTVGLLVLPFVAAGAVSRWVSPRRRRGLPLNSAARRLVLLLAVTLLYLGLDLEAFLGAFVAGVAVGVRPDRDGEIPGEGNGSASAQEVVQKFAYAFFIPIYFALVGVNLNLRHGFGVGWFVLFFVGACVVKAASVYLGARISDLPRQKAINLSIALNTRGGPGIVLATVTYSAGVINEEFYIWLVLLAVLTSVFSGMWLRRIPRTAFTDEVRTDEAVSVAA